MTGQDIQDRLDAIVEDLQTDGKGRTVYVMVRNTDNEPVNYTLSSDANGVVNAAQLADLQQFIDLLKNVATQYIADTAAYTAKAAELKAIAETPAYKAARASYSQANVSENYAELQNAKGAYAVV